MAPLTAATRLPSTTTRYTASMFSVARAAAGYCGGVCLENIRMHACYGSGRRGAASETTDSYSLPMGAVATRGTSPSPQGGRDALDGSLRQAVGQSQCRTRIPPSSAQEAGCAARLVTRPLAVKVQRVPRMPSKRDKPTRARPEFRPMWMASGCTPLVRLRASVVLSRVSAASTAILGCAHSSTSWKIAIKPSPAAH